MNRSPSPFAVVFYEREMEGGHRERERETEKMGGQGHSDSSKFP